VTALAGFITLGTVENLWVDGGDWSGWAYPARKTVTPLIGNGTDAGNVLVQEGALPNRLGSLSFLAKSPEDKDTIRGYEEDSDLVTFEDIDGSTCDVLILSFSSSQHAIPELWKISLQLMQLTEPIPAGS
jgi:hypothetical protein